MELNNKKILILGFGREGRDTFDFLKQNFSLKKIGVADQSKDIELKEDVSLHLGEKYLESIRDYELIIKSPGISMSKVTPYLDSNSIITSQTDIFFQKAKGLIIGITGTKGKSTTSSLIFKILSGKREVVLLGNIGEPTLKYLSSDTPERIYVYELSSFQLETVSQSPQIAIFLNIFKDHLDHHQNMREYIDAKAKITLFQNENDLLIFNKTDQKVCDIADKSKARKIPFDPKNDPLKIRRDITVPVEVLLEVAKIFNLPQSEVVEAIESFKPLPHRLEYVGKKNEISFYNDSAATIPEAAISAINKIGEDLNTLIIGGVDKGFDLQELAEKITESPIENLILFPETGRKIERLVFNKRIFRAESMGEAVNIALEETVKGKACLLAPAAASFNMFKDYKERGDLFRKYVQN